MFLIDASVFSDSPFCVRSLTDHQSAQPENLALLRTSTRRLHLRGAGAPEGEGLLAMPGKGLVKSFRLDDRNVGRGLLEAFETEG